MNSQHSKVHQRKVEASANGTLLPGDGELAMLRAEAAELRQEQARAEQEANPFEELFVEPKTWTFKSSSSDKTYTVREGRNGLHCDCWGYIAHRKCKHLKEVQNQLT